MIELVVNSLNFIDLIYLLNYSSIYLIGICTPYSQIFHLYDLSKHYKWGGDVGQSPRGVKLDKLLSVNYNSMKKIFTSILFNKDKINM